MRCVTGTTGGVDCVNVPLGTVVPGNDEDDEDDEDDDNTGVVEADETTLELPLTLKTPIVVSPVNRQKKESLGYISTKGKK